MGISKAVCVGAVVAATAGLAWAYVNAKQTGVSMTAAAREYLASLSGEQRKAAVLKYEDTKQRVDWHFIPKSHRKGLPLKDMNEKQREAALALLRASLSDTGYTKATQVIALEGVLRALEGRSDFRDPGRYYLTIFGDPAGEGRWGLSFEGHHLSVNWVVDGNRVISSTPTFLGANPAVVKKAVAGVKVGTRVLSGEEELAFELLGTLTPAQRQDAIIAERALREIRAPGAAQPPADPPVGLRYDAMNDRQKKILKGLIATYAGTMTVGVRTARLEAIGRAGFENVHFAWAGADRPGVGHYYRIQGPTFLIELANTQPDSLGNPANHVHCVWRDMRGDFAIPRPATPAATH
jgi:hypothetical protein